MSTVIRTDSYSVGAYAFGPMTNPGSVLSPKHHPYRPALSLVLSRALESHYVICLKRRPIDFTQQQPLVILLTGTVSV
jgi:hypothetical protein